MTIDTIPWEYLYGEVITSTGWTFEYIDDYMTFPRYEELKKYWKQQPPMHILMDALFTVLGCPLKKEEEKKEISTSNQQYDNSLDNLIADFTKAGGRL